MQSLKKNWEWYLLVLGMFVLVASFVFYGSPNGKQLAKVSPTPATNQTPTAKPTWTTPPAMTINANKTYIATMMTNKGPIKLELFAKKSPKTVNNFVFLAKQKFYDGLIFHRVIQNFMIQGGDPTGTGSGGPGYKFEDEFNNEKIVKGSLAMANSGANTNGSQFFIVTEQAQPHLDGKHTNFGKVIEGMDTVTAIAGVKVGAQDKPEEPVIITSITIEEK